MTASLCSVALHGNTLVDVLVKTKLSLKLCAVIPFGERAENHLPGQETEFRE
jgi:hypothetical protein